MHSLPISEMGVVNTHVFEVDVYPLISREDQILILNFNLYGVKKMPQVINTNLAAINARRNLETSSSDLGTSLQRLSSGLRVNSAKDDAAGLAIATRFTTNVEGLAQAGRNANDAISLVQTAEGALQEVSNILQRSRELAIQSANGTNSSSDRKALQSEVNQLKSELNRISTTTKFNGLNVLNGDLSSSDMQIGANANETVSVTIGSVHGTNIGSNEQKTDNAAGLEQSTYQTVYGYGQNTDIGTSVGDMSAAATNGYTAETFTITNTDSVGNTSTDTHLTTADDNAMLTAFNLNAKSGVIATAYNEVQLTGLTGMDAATDTFDIVLTGSDGSGASDSIAIAFADAAHNTFAAIATTINANTDAQARDVYAVGTATTLTIYGLQGHDVSLSMGSGAAVVSMQSLVNTDTAATNADSANVDITSGGRLDVMMDVGYSIAGSTGAHIATASTGRQAGRFDVTTTTESVNTDQMGLGEGGNFNNSQNNVGAQTLTISGGDGTTTVAISAGQTADSIVTSINGKSADTGVRSTAVTTVTVDTLSANGTVTMDLFGDNVNASNISAAVTATDLTALIKSINDVTGTTGITAAVGTDNSQMLLTHSAGKDIKISGFTHSSAVDYARTSDTIIVGDGTSLTTPSTQYSMNVTGGTGTSAVTLFDGAGANGLDSTIVGGEVTLISDQTFSVASSVANNVAGVGSGSLFSTAASVSNSSSASRVSDINIGSVAGAQSAISVLDEALQAISTIRSGLGALQARFETTTRSIANSIENLSAARSRILDADFAVETSDLTKNQILQQAGTSILSQANQIPQNILSLLQ